MPAELGGKWGTECLNTRFPLPTVLCAGYSVKLIRFFKKHNFIIICYSVTGHYVPNARTLSVYPVTKYALTSFNAALTNELAEFNSKVKVTVRYYSIIITFLSIIFG